MINTAVTKERKRRTTSTTRRKTAKSTTRKTKVAEPENIKSTRIEIELDCDRTDLEAALTYVKRGVPQNPHHPLLHHVSLVADRQGNSLELTTNSLDFGTNTKIKANVSQTGRLTVSLEILEKLVRKFPPGRIKLTGIVTEVAEERDSDGGGDSCQLILAPGDRNAEFELEASLSDEFPALPKVKSRLLAIPANLLLKHISSALISVASKQDNKILTGVQFKLSFDSEKLVRIDTISTDSSRLTFTSSFQPFNKAKLATEASFTLSSKVLKELKNSLVANSPEQRVRVYYDLLESNSESSEKPAAVMFAWNDKRIVARVMQGDYPDISAVRELVEKNDKIAVFNRHHRIQSC